MFQRGRSASANKAEILRNFFHDIKLSSCLLELLGSAILAFGLYNIHSVSHVTEGGVLGLTLLLEYWFDISPAVTGFIFNFACYALGFKMLGKTFLVYSFVSSAGFSVFYKIFECFPPVYPAIADMPLAASIVGALFVGVSCGICVRVGGAPSGDDALAMSLSHLFHLRIQRVYLLSDLIVLLLSLTYIPFSKIVYSLLTVILSGQVIGWTVRVPLPKRKKAKQSAPIKEPPENS